MNEEQQQNVEHIRQVKKEASIKTKKIISSFQGKNFSANDIYNYLKGEYTREELELIALEKILDVVLELMKMEQQEVEISSMYI